MKIVKLSYLAVALGLMLSLSSAAFAQTCQVTDPTDTLLNVRTQPYGAIVGQLDNGVEVRVIDSDYDTKGRPWSAVVESRNNRFLGWVYREYISCY